MIRPIRTTDLDAIYKIYAHYVNTTAYNFDDQPKPFTVFCQEMKEIARTYPFYVATYKDEVLGYAYVHPAFQKKAYQYCVEVTIYFREGNHYGMASNLLETLENACRENSFRWMISCITDSNDRSIAFHKKHGYIQMGKLPECGWKGGQWNGVIWMCKDLSSSFSSFIADSAQVIGDVEIAEESSIWFGSVVRADQEKITIGKQTNIQDHCTLHCSVGHPLVIKDRVTVGHGAIVHGCTIEDEVLIGMGAIVLDGAYIGSHSIIGAGALIPEGMKVPEGSVVLGCPGTIRHQITDEQLERIKNNAMEYVELAKQYMG